MGYGSGGCGAWAEGSCECGQPCGGNPPDWAFPQYASSKEYLPFEPKNLDKPMFQFNSLEELLTCDEVRAAIIQSVAFANRRVDEYRNEIIRLQVKLEAEGSCECGISWEAHKVVL